ncbi:MIF domain-containing protein [Pyricularia oryzae]|nr:MIF domain-containing protein [Pyricularia oryzae]
MAFRPNPVGVGPSIPEEDEEQPQPQPQHLLTGEAGKKDRHPPRSRLQLLARSSLQRLSFAHRKADLLQRQHHQSSSQTHRQHNKMSDRQSLDSTSDNCAMREIERGPPGDRKNNARSRMSQVDVLASKRRSTFFEDTFAASKGEKSGAKAATAMTERIRSEAIVMAEVKTNVILSDEFTFITELSYNLSLRYQRPVSSIVVSVQHGACMMYGGTFEPAYSMTIFALPSQMRPTTNKRNAVMIQMHMDEVLGVPSSRGIVRFVPMPEDNVAVSGRTIGSEITELAREAGIDLIDDDEGETLSKRRSVKLKNRLSVRQKSFSNFKDHSRSGSRELTPPLPSPPLEPGYSHDGVRERLGPGPNDPMPVRKTRRRKSFVASIFGWPREDTNRPPIPL